MPLFNKAPHTNAPLEQAPSATEDTQQRLERLERYVEQHINNTNLPEWVQYLERIMYQYIPEGIERQNMQFFDRIYKANGPLRSTSELTDDARTALEVYFHHREKAECALTVASSWYGGDYFEFGAQDLNTFRNMLSAYDICGMTRHHPDVRFYAFDMFGNPHANAPTQEEPGEHFHKAFGHYLHSGDQIEIHKQYIEQHNVYKDQCHLIQGLFENTLTEAFKISYQAEGRRIGYAFLDCNITPSYTLVFDYIFELMAEESYIYMDEYFQNPSVIEHYKQFTERLAKERNIGSVYLRNAGGFGGLFRLYPLGVTDDRYDIR